MAGLHIGREKTWSEVERRRVRSWLAGGTTDRKGEALRGGDA